MLVFADFEHLLLYELISVSSNPNSGKPVPAVRRDRRHFPNVVR